MSGRKAANGSGVIRKRADGRWEGILTTGTDPQTGKQLRRSLYGRTKAEVAEKIRAATHEVDQGIYTEPTKLTFGTWADIWLSEYVSHLKATTLSLYKRHLNKIIKPQFDHIKLMAVTAPAIQAFVNGLQRGEHPYSAKSVRNIHGVLHACLEQALELSFIRINPASSCKLPKLEKTGVKSMDSEGISKFLTAIHGHQHERVLLFDLMTGLRQGELLGLTWDAVNLEEGVIHLYRQLQLLDGEYHFMSLKNGKTRRIVLSQLALSTLKEQRRAQAGWRLFAGPAWRDNGFVFTDQLGDHLARQTVYKAYKAIVASIGMPDLRFHSLRHTYAVTSLHAGADVKSISEQLGHYSAAFTMDVYIDEKMEMRRESANKLDAFVEGLKNS